MRILAFLVFGIGIALAGGGAYFVSEFMKQQQVTPVTSDYVMVIAASRPLAQNTRLDPEHLKYIQWPRRSLPEGAFTSMTELFGDLNDRPVFAARSFEPGEPILQGKLSDSARFGDIPPGMRIVSIPINTVTGVSGFVNPGDRVDILLIRNVDGQLTSKVLLENVQVYAIDQRSDTESRGARTGRTVTVLVSSRNAQLLGVAQGSGQLSLTLRGDERPDDSQDGDIAKNGSVTTEDLNDFTKPDADPGVYIWVRKGGILERVRIDQ